jgi:radical SAM protein with 4Fe4S-binding SPASM domain
MQFLDAVRSRTCCDVRGSSVVRSGRTLAAANEYLCHLPVDHIKAQAVRVPPGAPGGLSPTERETYLDDLEALGRQVIAQLEVGKPPRDDRFNSRVLQLLAGQRRETYCDAGVTMFGITPSGDVLPCLLMDPHDCRLGHIERPPKTWVRGGRRWQQSRSLRPECRECSCLHLCGGGCPAMMPLCGADECELTRKNCEVATTIYQHFKSRPEALLALAGMT